MPHKAIIYISQHKKSFYQYRYCKIHVATYILNIIQLSLLFKPELPNRFGIFKKHLRHDYLDHIFSPNVLTFPIIKRILRTNLTLNKPSYIG